MLTYTVARLRNIAGLPSHAITNQFAGQLQLNLLFDIALVIDSAVATKNPNQWKFSQHAARLLTAAGQPLSIQQLGTINGQFENNFDQTLAQALDGILTIQPGAPLTRLQCDIALAYGVRNYGAHNTGAAPTVWNRFADLQRALFRTFCATIDYLYP